MAGLFRRVMMGIILCSALLIGNAFADAPKIVNYQGYLTDAVGTPVSGANSMVFNLYNSSVGGALLWSEAQPAVTVTNGIYQVNLGSVTPFNLSFDQPYYLGVAVGADPEMTPRQPFTGTPYALGLAPGSSVTLSDSGSNASALSVSSNSANANAFSVTKTGLNGNGGSFVINEATNNHGAVYGYTQGTGAAIFGVATTGASAGQFDIGSAANPKPALLAQTSGTGNAGRFLINNPSSTNHTIYTTTSGGGYGVWAGSASGIGVYGSSTTSNGIFGITSNGVTGVTGRADNAAGYGVYGVNWATGAYGYLGKEYGVFGNAGSMAGVRGQSSSSYGVYGSSTSAYGVYGSSDSSSGVHGSSSTSSGVYGSSASSHGVYGVNTAATSGIAGVYGRANNTTGTTYGVMGTCAGSTSYGVYGNHGTTSNYGYLGTNGYGAYGYNNSSHNYGGLGGATAGVQGSGTNGVYAYNSTNPAINAYLATGTYAGDFSSDIRVKGNINREYVTGSPKNAVPVAYGTINSDASVSGGSGNFTAVYDSTNKWYEITITAETYHYTSYSTTANTIGGTVPRFATTSSVSGRLIVSIFDLSGNRQQNMFNFVVFRP